MSEKKLKIFAVVLMVAAFICLAIGTAFAVDFMAEHPDEFAFDFKRPVVAANRPFVQPVVEPPLNQWDIPPFTDSISLSNFSGTYVLDFTLPVSEFGNVGSFSESSSVTYDVTSNQFFYFSFLGDLSLYSYYSDELIFSFEFTENYRDCRLSFGVNENGSYFFTLICQTTSYINETIFVMDDFSKYLMVCSFDVLNVGSNYRFYDSISSRVIQFPFFVNDPEAGIIVNDHISFLNELYKGKVFYSYEPSLGIAFVDQIVEILVSGLTGIGEAMGASFSTLAEAIFINGTGLSTFGILVVVFSAVSLGLSLTRFVLNFCSSWGKRNR